MKDAAEVIEELRRRLPSYPKEIRPGEYGTLQFNLGLALAELPTGDRPSQLREAILAYNEALSVFDQRSPSERARVLNALGAAERELGMNLVARDRFRQALALVDPSRAPAEYGAAANNLGLILGELQENDEAEEILQAAVAAFAAPEHHRQRLASLHNLGQVQAGRGTREGFRAAIETFTQAQREADPEEASYVYGMISQSLGIAHLSVPDERDRHLPAAEAAFRLALNVFTRRSYPFQHAVVKNNLGLSYLERPQPTITELRFALSSFEDAVRTFDPRLHERWWKEAYANLGRAESALAEAGAAATRPEHFAELVTSQAAPARLDLIRSRLRDIFSSGPRQAGGLAAFDHALLRLPPPAVVDLTSSWLQVLMEEPDHHLQAALQSRLEAHENLPPEKAQAAEAAFERAVGELEVLQRIRVRQLAAELGYRRPDSSNDP